METLKWGPLIAKDKYYPTQAIIDDAENYRDQNYGVHGDSEC